MSIVTMAVHDTGENGRTAFTEQTLLSLAKTVNWRKHRLFIVDNNSCQKTKDLFRNYGLQDMFKGAATLITLLENVGTARALNMAMLLREPGEHFVKIDNDVVIHSNDWVEELEEALQRMQSIGIVGLKRKDIIQSTWHENPFYRSELIMLPHFAGQRWITFEKTDDVIGTCTMFSSRLLERIGFSFQPGLYGYEDVLFCKRARLAGFDCGFLNHINIDHIDPGDGKAYIAWKHKEAGDKTNEVIKILQSYEDGTKSIYHEFY